MKSLWWSIIEIIKAKNKVREQVENFINIVILKKLVFSGKVRNYFMQKINMSFKV